MTQMNYQPPRDQARPTSGLAIASLVVGIMGFCVPLLGAVAVVLGAFGLKSTKDGRRGGRGLAVAGLSLGVLTLIVWVGLFAALVPAMGRARDSALRAACQSNLRQVGMAMQLYANENNGNYPTDFDTLMKTQDVSAAQFECPSGRIGGRTSGQAQYLYFGAGKTTKASPDAVLAVDNGANHGSDGGSVLYGDGRVEFLGKTEFDKLLSDLNGGRSSP